MNKIDDCIIFSALVCLAEEAKIDEPIFTGKQEDKIVDALLQMEYSPPIDRIKELIAEYGNKLLNNQENRA